MRTGTIKCYSFFVRVLILGCGYVGLAVARRLVARGHDVFGLRRTHGTFDELRTSGVQPLTGDVTDPASLRGLPGDFPWVINTVSSAKGDAEVYRRVYLDGTRHVLTWLQERQCQRYVYTSSTSVYGQIDGLVVTENSPTEPNTATAKILVETERLLLETHLPLTFAAGIFRVAGIYGPGRGHLFQQYRRGEARISGDGSRLINMVHRDDLVAALAAFLETPDLPKTARLYNAVDDEAVTQLDFFRWLSRRLAGALPPYATEAENVARKRGLTQKRVSNARLRSELGWVPRFPTFREGYESLIWELESRPQGGSC